jgi:hypothetical protein
MTILGWRKPSEFDEAVNRVLANLKEIDLGTEEYVERLAYLERLNKLRSEERSRKVSPDTMAIVAANILGILIVVGYEQGNVIASKGLGFVLRTKQ